MRVVNGCAAVCAAAALCGCGSGAGGSGLLPPKVISLTDFAAVFDEVRGSVPTSDMPAAGSATYAGAIRLDVVDAGATPVGAVAGQLAFTVDFDTALDLGQPAGQRMSPVSGRGARSRPARAC